MSRPKRSGFTLIELLVVVAIIAILAGIVAVALPRALERAKIARMTGALNNLRTSLTQYYTEHNSYPPAYGYRSFQARFTDPFSVPAQTAFWVGTMMGAIQMYSAVDLYDEFSEAYSTRTPRRSTLSLLEFSPIARTEAGRNVPLEPVRNELYLGNNLPQQVQAQLEQTRRPFVYVPVNKTQLTRAKKYWTESGDWLATTWNPSDVRPGQYIQNMTFPPPTYDAFVLIGVGPAVDSFGLLDDPPFINSIPPEDRYHLAGLRAYYLATRDLNGNGVLDFHYDTRARGGEADARYTIGNGEPIAASFFTSQQPGFDVSRLFPNSLPSVEKFNGYGPWIFVNE